MKMKKSIALIVSLILVLTVTVGGTLAFLIARSGEVKNTFTPSKITTSVEEDFSNGKKENVCIKNTGDIPAYIRAAVIITWQDEKGNVCGEKPAAKTDYRIDPEKFPDELPADWVKGTDGFYYYSKAVPAGQKTGPLINKIEDAKTKVINGVTYYLCVEILGSGIQAEPFEDYQAAWAATKN